MTREISPAGLQITPDKNLRQQDNQAAGISEKHQPFRPSTGQLTALKKTEGLLQPLLRKCLGQQDCHNGQTVIINSNMLNTLNSVCKQPACMWYTPA